jgi:hypothetical protein
LALFGTAAVTAMVVAYALERRSKTFVLAFAAGCALSSVYGFFIGSIPFGAVEAAWAALAIRRYALRARGGRE